jgi:hypothetical protein
MEKTNDDEKRHKAMDFQVCGPGIIAQRGMCDCHRLFDERPGIPPLAILA